MKPVFDIRTPGARVTADNREALRQALRHTASALNTTGLPFALCGGYALWARGAPEPEHDVDFMVAETDVDEVARLLADAGFEVRRPPEDWLFKVDTDGVTVDIVHRVADVPVDEEALHGAEKMELLGIRLPILDATELITIKLRTLTERYCDLAGLLPAARAVREQLDWAKLKRDAAGNPFAETFLFLTDRLGISSH
jgi:predicted nucleotidyltransferase